MDYDYNQVENSTGNSPLFIACKFNSLNIVELLLSKSDCKKLVKNYENLNEFDIAFLKGNYSICYYLLYEYKSDNKSKKNDNEDEIVNDNNIENDPDNINTEMNINTKDVEKNRNYDINQIYQKYFYNTNFDLDTFLSLQEANLYPLFNMNLFFKSLCKKIPPEKTESFAPERKKTKDLLTKVPDPNETWGHFFKRMVNLELYNPPLVDKRNVTQMNSLYMNTQMKLLENEYGIKLSYYNPDSDNNQNPDEEEESPIVQIKKKKRAKKNEENDDEKEDDKKEDKEEEKEEDKEEEKDDDNNKESIDDKSENLSVLRIKGYFNSKRNKKI